MLAYLGLEDEPAMRAFFEEEMSASAAHKERWREGLTPGAAGGAGPRVREDPRSSRARGLPLRSGAAAGLRAPARVSGSELVFIGGTGRSGTHALAQLLGRHSGFADVPIEARFHCNKRGHAGPARGPDHAAADTSPSCAASGGTGSASTASHAASTTCSASPSSTRALERFEATYAEDPIGGCRELYLDLL